jgi:hypothetical protein
MQKMQSELAMMKNNLHPFASTSTASASNSLSVQDEMDSGHSTPLMMADSNNMALATSSSNEQSVTWKLSLSPSGLRIDTNIASVADLYRILLNGISQLNINNDSTTSLFNPESTNSPLSSHTSNHRRAQPASAKLPGGNGRRTGNYLDNMMDTSTSTLDKGGRLWEVDDNEARKILQEKKASEDTLPKEVLDNLMHTCYNTCFLAYQTVDKDSFMQQYMSDEGLDPLLANSINAWVSKHGCIYHHAAPNASTTSMGEVYFKNARQLLKKCFDISSPTTIHALLNLYMYQLSSERSSLAYLYIGLAIRMAQDLKFHKKEHMSADLNQRETNKRLWWSAYWLDLCAALESNRPTMVDDKDCDLDYPVRLDHEDDETGYRIHFSVYSIKLMRIRKDITKHLPSEQSGQSLLSAISRLENALTNWMGELPLDLHFDEVSFQKTGSFRDEACLILNIQYQTTWIMLHKFFLPKQDQTATPVALLSLNICTKSANLITRMLSIYAAHLHWCQFFYAMDGIIASVTIHQVNALSSEKEVSCLAQRNLIITASVLKESPLMYMVKVCEIIESIEGFLQKNGLSADLGDLPAVNEDSVNQQSISSVFHPAVFESQQQQQHQQQQQQQQQHMMPQQQPPPPQQQQQQQPQQQYAESPSIQSQHTMMNSPQSHHSSSTTTMTNMRVPSQLAAANAMFSNTNNNSSRTSNAAAGQQQPIHKPVNNTMYQGGMLMENSMFLGDPTAGLMNFNLPPQGNNDMDQLLLRNMGFDLNSTSSAGNTTDYGMLNNATPSSNASYAGSYENYGQYNQFNTTNTSTTTSTATVAVTNDTSTNSNAYPHFLNNTDLFGLQPQPQQAPPPPQQQQQQQHQQQQQQPAAVPYSTNNFDPSHLFGTMNMDPATMSALLYNNVPQFNNTPSFNSNNSNNSNTNSNNNNNPTGTPTEEELLYGSVGGRKRVHRDWEDAA